MIISKAKTLILTSFIFFGCHQNKKEESNKLKSRPIEHGHKIDFGENFEASSPSFAHSISDSLRQQIISKHYFFENNTEFDSKICENISIMLLKMDAHNSSEYFLSFDLLEYRDDATMLLLNKHFDCFHVDTTGFKTGSMAGQGYYSHMPYHSIKNDSVLIQIPAIKTCIENIKEAEKMTPK